MKWDDEKLDLLKDNYAYVSNEELAEQIGCTVNALVKKASRENLSKATNNQINDGIKFCTYCNTYHEIDNFYKDKHANSGYQYYCKLYYKSHNPRETTTPLKNKSHNPRETKAFGLDGKRNPITIINNKECIICKVCGNAKELDHFYKNSKMINGRVNVCKECSRGKDTHISEYK